MNSFEAKVVAIERVDELSLVSYVVGSERVSMLGLELHPSLQVGSRVRLAIKPSHITILKEFSTSLSSLNLVNAKVNSIEKGQILSYITVSALGASLEILLPQKSLEKIALCEGEGISLLLPESELSIVKIYDV